ncbi:MAG: hypothetical protein GY952_13895 [Rhodobacteraceae bacterium]|nr:hypothetical protein [Paracoccaceae bacterium]
MDKMVINGPVLLEDPKNTLINDQDELLQYFVEDDRYIITKTSRETQVLAICERSIGIALWSLLVDEGNWDLFVEKPKSTETDTAKVKDLETQIGNLQTQLIEEAAGRRLAAESNKDLQDTIKRQAQSLKRLTAKLNKLQNQENEPAEAVPEETTAPEKKEEAEQYERDVAKVKAKVTDPPKKDENATILDGFCYRIRDWVDSCPSRVPDYKPGYGVHLGEIVKNFNVQEAVEADYRLRQLDDRGDLIYVQDIRRAFPNQALRPHKAYVDIVKGKNTGEAKLYEQLCNLEAAQVGGHGKGFLRYKKASLHIVTGFAEEFLARALKDLDKAGLIGIVRPEVSKKEGLIYIPHG